MLRIRRLHIEIKTNNPQKGGIYGFDSQFVDGLNFIASNENTSGKSSVIEAIYYCLGFEEIIGGKNEQVLTSAYKSQIDDGLQTWKVLESSAFLEISNGNEIVTVFRAAVMEGRDSRLVTVYYGDYESIGKQKTPPEDMYLHDGGAATNAKGFHHFLESFLHLELPIVQTTRNDQKLYLQTIFSCLFIEQKHGWGDIFSGMPFFGIKDAKTRVVEYLLGLQTYSISKEKEKLKAIKSSILIDWKSLLNDINRTMNRENCTISGISPTPKIMSDDDFSQICLRTLSKEIVDDAIKELLEEREKIKHLKPRNIDNFDALNQELNEIEYTIGELEQKQFECNHQIRISSGAISQSAHTLDTITRDLRNNKDAAKLKRMGANNGCKASLDICPVCNQKIQDSLLYLGADVPVMSIEENIRHLEEQKKVLEFNRNSHKATLDEMKMRQSEIQSRLYSLRKLAQTIRSDLYSTEVEWSESLIQKLVAIESKIHAYEQLKETVSQQLDLLHNLSARWREYKEADAALPKKSISESDVKLMRSFKKNFVDNLHSYNYKSAPNIDEVEIPIETCLPSIDGFDMKFDSSASDNIRIIWSFTMALLQTSITHGGNHPGLVIFDEPAQHSIVTSDMDSLIQSVIKLGNSSQVIIGITLNNEELKETIQKIPTEVANAIIIKDHAFKLL